MKHWSEDQLLTLRRLRSGFLTGGAGAADYWRSSEDLSLYDRTFGERIGWKWDAVLAELVARGWRPNCRRILDWGCGSGVAGRRVLEKWPAFTTVALHDRSPLARRFAEARAREQFPGISVQAEADADAETLLLVSHVLNELPPEERLKLLNAARRAGEVIWVEAGTFADSRALVDVRESLLDTFGVIAPCTHHVRCGLLAPENARHWCHRFARVPAGVFQDAAWAELSRELGIDLRSLPYSFLVLSRTRHPQPSDDGASRVVGRTRDSKGYSRVLSCNAAGLKELILQKRDSPDLLRDLRKDADPAPIYRWVIRDGKIAGQQPL